MAKLKKTCLFSSILILSGLTTFANAAVTPSESLKQEVSKIGNVKEVLETPFSNSFAWLLEKQGKTIVMMNTSDDKYFFIGTIYDFKNKEPVSDQLALKSLNYASKEFREKVISQNKNSSKHSGFDKSPINFSIEPSLELKNKMASLGNVKEVKPTQFSNILAWYLEKNGKTMVFYTSTDANHFMKGTFYDMKTKKVESDIYMIDSLQYASPEFKNKILNIKAPDLRIQEQEAANTQHLSSAEQEVLSKGMFNIPWNKPTPEALKLVDTLAGAKENNGKPEDTLYIIYDPNCPWCHKAYEASRPFVKKGYTIKWIPTTALGVKGESTISLAIAPIRDAKNLDSSFNNRTGPMSKLVATPEERKQLETNLSFLFAYSKNILGREGASVPFGLFLERTSGKLTHLEGLHDPSRLEIVFGKQ